MRGRRTLLLALLIVAVAGNTYALELNRNFSDNMVLQRDKPLVIKGIAEKGAEVSVSFMGQTKSAKADDQGVWNVTLEPVAASAKGAKLAASSKGKTVAIDNVVVGDIILHARQTSIDITLGKSKVSPKNTLQDTLYPAAGYNGTLHPLAGTALKAVVVQLGNDYPFMLYQELLESDNPSDYAALDKVKERRIMIKFTRSQFIQSSALGALFTAMPSALTAAEAPEKLPNPPPRANIIFVKADDLGYRNLGCYGSKTILTPSIDKLCAEGVKFTNCYSGDSVCAPARSTLMTGYHIGHTPVRGNNGGTTLSSGDITVADVLKKAGYVTGGFGKWDLGNEGSQGAAEKHGFDTFFGYYNQGHAHDYYTTHLFRNSEQVDLASPNSHYSVNDKGRTERISRYSHYAFFDETVKFIKESVKSGKPFFCYAPWTLPHADYVIPEDDPAWALYKDKPWNVRAKLVTAMDSIADRHVGEILNLLKELGIDENTIVFFTSDNGASRNWPGIHDVSKDIGEENNLAEKHPEIVAKLSDFMQKAWTEPRSQEAGGTYTRGDRS